MPKPVSLNSSPSTTTLLDKPLVYAIATEAHQLCMVVLDLHIMTDREDSVVFLAASALLTFGGNLLWFLSAVLLLASR